MTDELLEQLAELEHKQWIHWTKYFLENMTEENIKRWKKQCETECEDLSEEDKHKDKLLEKCKVK